MQTARISCPITSFAASDCVGGAGVSPQVAFSSDLGVLS